MLSGKIEGLRGTRQQVISRVIHSLESAGVEVTRTEQGVKARVPGADARLLPMPMASSHFDDHLEVRVCEQGSAAYRWVYWTRFQVGLHALIALMFALDMLFRQSSGSVLLPAFLCAQLVPVAVFVVSTQLRLRAIFDAT